MAKTKQYKYNQMPDNEHTRLMKEVHDALNSKDIRWDNIIWVSKEKEFIVQIDNNFFPANSLLADAGHPSVE